MIENKTSAAVAEVVERTHPSPIVGSILVSVPLEALLKYQKMEAALEQLRFKCLGDAGGECLCPVVESALVFDPLTNPSHE